MTSYTQFCDLLLHWASWLLTCLLALVSESLVCLLLKEYFCLCRYIMPCEITSFYCVKMIRRGWFIPFDFWTIRCWLRIEWIMAIHFDWWSLCYLISIRLHQSHKIIIINFCFQNWLNSDYWHIDSSFAYWRMLLWDHS